MKTSWFYLNKDTMMALAFLWVCKYPVTTWEKKVCLLLEGERENGIPCTQIKKWPCKRMPCIDLIYSRPAEWKFTLSTLYRRKNNFSVLLFHSLSPGCNSEPHSRLLTPPLPFLPPCSLRDGEEKKGGSERASEWLRSSELPAGLEPWHVLFFRLVLPLAIYLMQKQLRFSNEDLNSLHTSVIGTWDQHTVNKIYLITTCSKTLLFRTLNCHEAVSLIFFAFIFIGFLTASFNHVCRLLKVKVWENAVFWAVNSDTAA